MLLARVMRFAQEVWSLVLTTVVAAVATALVTGSSYLSMIIPGESLLILGTVPAAYVVYAANEAEKAATVKLVHVQPYGAFGRLMMSGVESHIDSAMQAAARAIEGVAGREHEVSRSG